MSETYRNPAKLDHLDDPQWTSAGRVHDWRNHVGENTKRLWLTFTDEQRVALAADADDRAGQEEWE